MKVEEACEIIFPIFLRALEKTELGDRGFGEVREWGIATKRVLDAIYPEDVFYGVSEDKGAVAIKLIRDRIKQVIEE